MTLKLYSEFSQSVAIENDDWADVFRSIGNEYKYPHFDWSKPYTLNILKSYSEFLYDYYCHFKQLDKQYMTQLYYTKLLTFIYENPSDEYLTNKSPPDYYYLSDYMKPIDKRIADFIYTYVYMIPVDTTLNLDIEYQTQMTLYKKSEHVNWWYLCDTVLSIRDTLLNAIEIIRNWWLHLYYKPNGKYARKVCKIKYIS